MCLFSTSSNVIKLSCKQFTVFNMECLVMPSSRESTVVLQLYCQEYGSSLEQHVGTSVLPIQLGSLWNLRGSNLAILTDQITQI